MKFLALGDIEGNIRALEAALDHSRQYGPFDGLYFTGDAIGRGENPDATLQLLAEHNFIGVAGNHESDTLHLAEFAGPHQLNFRVDYAVAIHNVTRMNPSSLDLLRGFDPEPRRIPMGFLVHGNFGATAGFHQYAFTTTPEEATAAIEGLHKLIEPADALPEAHIVGLFAHSHKPSVIVGSKSSSTEIQRFEIYGPRELQNLRARVENPFGIDRTQSKGRSFVLFNPGPVDASRYQTGHAHYGIIKRDPKGLTLRVMTTAYQ